MRLGAMRDSVNAARIANGTGDGHLARTSCSRWVEQVLQAEERVLPRLSARRRRAGSYPAVSPQLAVGGGTAEESGDGDSKRAAWLAASERNWSAPGPTGRPAGPSADTSHTPCDPRSQQDGRAATAGRRTHSRAETARNTRTAMRFASPVKRADGRRAFSLQMRLLPGTGRTPYSIGAGSAAAGLAGSSLRELLIAIALSVKRALGDERPVGAIAVTPGDRWQSAFSWK
jgi:hypothetical protein